MMLSDIKFILGHNFDLNSSVLDRSNRAQNKILLEVKLGTATGVPIPEEKQIERKNFILREVGVTLFDRTQNKFISNTVYVEAYWLPECED